MTTQTHSVQPYLNFNGRCEEAIEFYRQALGAEVAMMLRFKDTPDKSMITPGAENKIMHANFCVGESVLFASDGRCAGPTGFAGFSLSLTVKTVAEAEKFFAALADGGQIQMPLAKTFFSPNFGMVADRFGICWMVYVVPPENK